MNANERFDRYVDKEHRECWAWLGATAGTMGYGRFWLNRGVVQAHRFSYERYVGPIPMGMLVLHRCDNPKCVNPDHLFLGTDFDNLHDAMRKGRADTSGLRVGCPADQPRHPITGRFVP